MVESESKVKLQVNGRLRECRLVRDGPYVSLWLAERPDKVVTAGNVKAAVEKLGKLAARQ